MYSALLFIDPGLRTGWASFDVASRRFAAGITDPLDTFDVMERWVNEHAGTAALLGCERFTVNATTHRKGAEAMHWPWELTGAGRYLAWRNDISFCDAHTPVAAKRFATDDKLKAAGLYTPGREDHARDAARHLLLRLAKLRLVTL